MCYNYGMKKEHYDIAVIGGGPAGLMAAGCAAKLGARVALLEKNDRPGIKLLLTGNGRCNITNTEKDLRRFVDLFGKNGKFLFQALNAFSPEATVDFFNRIGLKTKTEPGGRVFPASDKAAEVRDTLLAFIKKNNVRLMINSSVKNILKKGNRIEKLILADGEFAAEKFIICTGGLSYPATGSNGDGLKWATNLGHSVIEPVPALTPVIVKEKWIKKLQGMNMSDAQVIIYQDGKKASSVRGEILFTHEGLSGPAVLNASREIGAAMKQGAATLNIDFYPGITEETLDLKLQEVFRENANKDLKNALDQLMPKRLSEFVPETAKIEPAKKAGAVTREERKAMMKLLKTLVVSPSSLAGFEKAIITAGGISLKEIDPRTMKSLIVENLFFAGEILDLDGPTGGYNLQVCWSTGYLAGENAAKR